MRKGSPTRPFSLMTGCVLGAAGAASAMTVVIARLLLVAPPPCASTDAGTEAAEVAGLQAFERAGAAYDETAARGDVLDAAEAELAWASVRDRYRYFLAYPEAVARWPELAALARDRAADIDALVVNLAELQRLEIQAEQLAAAEAEMATAREQTAHAHARLVLDPGPDCTLGAP